MNKEILSFMKDIMDKINTLVVTPGKLDKIALLKEYMKDQTFLTIIELTFDTTMSYNVSKLSDAPKHQKYINSPPDVVFDDLVNFLYFLSEKQGASNEDKKYLTGFCFDDNWKSVIIKIINKDFKCGIGPKLINDALPGTITETPYMRCSNSNMLERITWPAYGQEKEDGLFAYIFHNQRKVKVITRAGNELIFPEKSLEEEIQKFYPKYSDTMVYSGELRIKKNGKYLDRKTSNGIMGNALKKNQTMTIQESKEVHFICWDVITEKEYLEGLSEDIYDIRLGRIEFLEECGAKRNHLCNTTILNSIQEAQDWALELIEDGKEGIIVKDKKGIWKFHTSPLQVKLKAGDIGIDGAERECEMKVVGWYYGKVNTKYENCLGGLKCSSSDGIINVNVGGGFKDAERGLLEIKDGVSIIVLDFESWVRKKYMDKIVTIRFNEVITEKKEGKYSLFLPRFIEERHDKTEADTLEYIKTL